MDHLHLFWLSFSFFPSFFFALIGEGWRFGVGIRWRFVFHFNERFVDNGGWKFANQKQICLEESVYFIEGGLGLRVPSRIVEARWRVFFCVRERILLGVNRMKSRECVRRIEVLSLIICYFRVLFVIIIIMNVANKLSK